MSGSELSFAIVLPILTTFTESISRSCLDLAGGGPVMESNLRTLYLRGAPRHTIGVLSLASSADCSFCLFACDEACVNLCTRESENQGTHALGLGLELLGNRRAGRISSMWCHCVAIIVRNNVPS